MKNIEIKEQIELEISNNEMVLLYFGNNTWGVSKDMKPKLEAIAKEYPKVNILSIDVNKYKEIAAYYEVFTIPAIILYIEGKQFIKEARHISLKEFRNKIDRYYNMIFD